VEEVSGWVRAIRNGQSVRSVLGSNQGRKMWVNLGRERSLSNAQHRYKAVRNRRQASKESARSKLTSWRKGSQNDLYWS
jgi:hypothetical protein